MVRAIVQRCQLGTTQILKNNLFQPSGRSLVSTLVALPTLLSSCCAPSRHEAGFVDARSMRPPQRVFTFPQFNNPVLVKRLFVLFLSECLNSSRTPACITSSAALRSLAMFPLCLPWREATPLASYHKSFLLLRQAKGAASPSIRWEQVLLLSHGHLQNFALVDANMLFLCLQKDDQLFPQLFLQCIPPANISAVSARSHHQFQVASTHAAPSRQGARIALHFINFIT